MIFAILKTKNKLITMKSNESAKAKKQSSR